MNTIVHAFKSTMVTSATRPWAVSDAWQLPAAVCLVAMVVLSALALVYMKDMNRRLLGDVEGARVSLEAQRLEYNEASLMRGQLLRPDVLQAKAAAMGMVMPKTVHFLRVSTNKQ